MKHCSTSSTIVDRDDSFRIQHVCVHGIVSALNNELYLLNNVARAFLNNGRRSIIIVCSFVHIECACVCKWGTTSRNGLKKRIIYPEMPYLTSPTNTAIVVLFIFIDIWENRTWISYGRVFVLFLFDPFVFSFPSTSKCIHCRQHESDVIIFFFMKYRMWNM